MLKSGDQALGAYQVMKSNLPSWSTEAFGKPMSASQFMAIPARKTRYSNSSSASCSTSMAIRTMRHRHGSPAARYRVVPARPTCLGTTGSQYVDKFNAALSKLGGVTDHATSAIGGLGGASEGLISQFSKMGQSLLSQLTPATSSSSGSRASPACSAARRARSAS
jgi:hypothetical protein